MYKLGELVAVKDENAHGAVIAVHRGRQRVRYNVKLDDGEVVDCCADELEPAAQHFARQLADTDTIWAGGAVPLTWARELAHAFLERTLDRKEAAALRWAVEKAREWHGNYTGDSAAERNFLDNMRAADAAAAKVLR